MVHSRVLDAPSKLDNAKLSSDDRPKIVSSYSARLSGQRLPITLHLRLRSWDVFAYELLPNQLRLFRLASSTAQ